MSRNIILLIICSLVLAEVSSHKWYLLDAEKKSSACVGAKTLACTKHRLSCSQNQQIKIQGAFYGFVKSKHGCPTSRTTCSSQEECDCEWYHGDCGLSYSGVDEDEVMRCSGQRSCGPRSATSGDNSKCHIIRPWRNRKYNPKNSYTEIDYECIKVQRQDETENVIQGQQIVLNASTDYTYTYTASGKRWRPIIFYHTNRQLESFYLHGYPIRAGVKYRMVGKMEFIIQPNTDTLIILTGYFHQSDIKVSYKRHMTDEQSTSIKTTHQRPHPIIKSTTPKRLKPTSTSIRPRPETRMTTKALEMKTKTTTQAFDMKTKTTTEAFDRKTKTTTEAFDRKTKTTTEAFDMEEVTRNIEDEIIQEETNDRMRSQASVAVLRGLKGGLIGGVVGGVVAVIIILLIVGLLLCKRRRQKTEKPVVVDNGISNPAYAVSDINPKLQGPPPAYEEIQPKYDNSRVLRTANDYDNTRDVITNQRNDVKDKEVRQLAGVNMKDYENQKLDD